MAEKFQRVISADSHINEPYDLYWNAVGNRFGDRTPRVIREYQGQSGHCRAIFRLLQCMRTPGGYNVSR